MSSPFASLPNQDFVFELFDRAKQTRAFGTVAWAVAIGAHVLAAGLALGEVRRAPAPPPPLEVELAPPPEPVASPIVTPLPKAQEPASARPNELKAAAPPQPAPAGALLTAKADPMPTPAAEEPVDFTNDPSLLGFGSGVVAIGGKAKVGLANAQPSAAPAGRGDAPLARAVTGDGLTPASDLTRKPSLGESDPCRGYFPNGAADDVATAAVMVTIAKNGAVSSVRLLSESPAQQGFGAAARTCMSSKRFSPGLDRDGQPTATAIRVNIRFSR
jgi:periplasmic protein TonB